MEKKINKYSVKNSTNNSIKDIEQEKRSVAIYLAKFGNIDSDGDMIQKGAFKKSLKERGINSATNRQIAFLRYHDWEQQIGKFTTLEEDDFGLFAVAQLGTSTKGEDAWRDYNDGIIREHSIGFQYVSDKIKYIEDKENVDNGYFEIKEVILYEGSAVTFGANEMTPVMEIIKSEHKIEQAKRISNEIDILAKALSNGLGSDERLYEIEMKFKYLNSQLLQLAEAESFVTKHSLINEPALTNLFNWNAVINNIKF